MIKISTFHNGYIALLTVLIVSTVLLMIGLSIGLGSVRNNQATVGQSDLLENRFVAEACAEQAIYNLKLDSNYAGSEQISFGTSTCSIGVIGGAGVNNRTIPVTATRGVDTLRLDVVVGTTSPITTITSWKEVPSF